MGVDPAIDITAEQRKIILTLLNRHLPGTAAWVYGSRAKWTSRPQSDLDMVVFAAPYQRVRVGALRDALEESDLPFRVDLFVWDDIPEAFLKQIERDHVVLKPNARSMLENNGWVSLQLGDVCTKVGSGATPRGGKETYLEDGSISLIRSQNVHNDGFKRDGIAYISEEQANQLSNVEVRPNDVLLNITGDSVARACQVPSDVLPARVNQHVAIIRPNPNKLSARFLRYLLVSPDTQSMLLSWAGSGGTRNALTKGMIESLEIPVPENVTVQRAIAHVLGTLDDKIELNRRMNETLEAMARALFKSWFVDFDPVRAKMEGRDPGLPKPLTDLFPDRLVASELGEIPEGWEAGTLGDVAESPRRGVDPKELDGSTPYIGLEHLPRRSIALTEWETSEKITSNKSAFKKGEFLFGKLRPYFHKVGVAPTNGVCSTDIVVTIPKSIPYAAFVLSVISSVNFVSYTDQTSTGTKMPRTSWKTMSRYELMLPPEPAAQAFQALTEPLFDRVISNIHTSRSYAKLRDALLPKLISGDIRLRDAERAVEAVV